MIVRPLAAAGMILALAACDPGDPDGAFGYVPGNEPELPTALQGRWGQTAQDCARGGRVPEGLMTVGPETIQFYESQAKLARIVESGPRRLLADYEYSGEGTRWMRRMLMEVSADGTTLTRSAAGSAEGAVVYTSCG